MLLFIFSRQRYGLTTGVVGTEKATLIVCQTMVRMGDGLVRILLTLLEVVLNANTGLQVPFQVRSLREGFPAHDASKFLHATTLVPDVSLQRAGILVVFITIAPRALVAPDGIQKFGQIGKFYIIQQVV